MSKASIDPTLERCVVETSLGAVGILQRERSAVVFIATHPAAAPYDDTRYRSFEEALARLRARLDSPTAA